MSVWKKFAWSGGRAEKLGYKVNAKAQSLRQGKDRTIAVLLPGIEDIRYATMYEVFQSEFVQRGYAVQLFSTHSIETTELAMLSDALNARVSAVITSSCLADAVDRYRAETPGSSAGVFAADRLRLYRCDVRRV